MRASDVREFFGMRKPFEYFFFQVPDMTLGAFQDLFGRRVGRSEKSEPHVLGKTKASSRLKALFIVYFL